MKVFQQIIIFLAGASVFGVLMAWRNDFSSSYARMAVTGIAGAVLGMTIYWVRAVAKRK